MGILGIGRNPAKQPVSDEALLKEAKRRGLLTNAQNALGDTARGMTKDVVELGKNEVKKTVNTFWESCLETVRQTVVTTAVTFLTTILMSRLPWLRKPLQAVQEAQK